MRLVQQSDYFVVSPLRPEEDGLKPAILVPRMNAMVVEAAARTCRQCFQERGVCVTVLGYLDFLNATWHFQLPWQTADPDGSLVDLRHPQSAPPGRQFRLAATFTACTTDVNNASAWLPGFDGLHLVHHVSDGWLTLGAFACTDGEYLTVPISHLLADPATLSNADWGRIQGHL